MEFDIIYIFYGLLVLVGFGVLFYAMSKNMFGSGGVVFFEYIRQFLSNFVVLILGMSQLVEAGVKGIGNILSVFAIEFGGIITPVATAIIIYQDLIAYLHFTTEQALATGVAIEFLGIAAGYTLIKVMSNNQIAKSGRNKKDRTKDYMPQFLPWLAYVMYFFSVQGIIVGLGVIEGSEAISIGVKSFIALLSVASTIIIGYKSTYKDRFDEDVLNIRELVENNGRSSEDSKNHNQLPDKLPGIRRESLTEDMKNEIAMLKMPRQVATYMKDKGYYLSSKSAREWIKRLGEEGYGVAAVEEDVKINNEETKEDTGW